MIDVGKEGFGPSTSQDHINALLVEHAKTGAQVVRLKSGDATVFGRLDEEIDAVNGAGIAFSMALRRSARRSWPNWFSWSNWPGRWWIIWHRSNWTNW